MGDAAEPDPGDVRIGDAERQAVVDMLSRHASAGRLTLDEFTERSGQVFAARTRADLQAVLHDLPGATTAAEGAGDGEAPWEPASHDTMRAGGQRKRRRFVAIMSGTAARGRWWAPRKIYAWAWWGHVLIDLRDAVITSPTVTIKARAYMGGVTVIVPEGVPADMYGSVIMGGAHNATSSRSPVSGAPQIHVKARGLWGGVTVKSKRRLSPEERAKVKAAKEMTREAVREATREMTREAARRHRHAHHRSHSRPGDSASPERGQAGPQGELPSPSRHDLIPPIGPLPDMVRNKLGPQLLAWVDQLSADPVQDPSRPGAAEDPQPTGAQESPGPTASGTDTGPGQLDSGTFTMLVTDIVGSTRMSAQLGDQRWMDVLRWHNDLLRSLVTNNGGTEVKAQGDGFIFAFPSARRAILTAIEIQRNITKDCADHTERDLQLRVGLHTGEVMADDGDLHGQNVVMAVRIADAATPGEILVSGLTHELTASAGDIGFGEGREVPLKGMEGARRVHAVSWQ